MTSLTALLLPSAATEDTANAAIVVLHEQCKTVSAEQSSASAASADHYPLKYISNSLIVSASASSRLFASAASVLLCFARMQQHPERAALVARLADPMMSFSTATAIRSLHDYLLHRSQRNATASHANPCPHADEDLIALSRAEHEQTSAAAVVALLLLRLNIEGNASTSSAGSSAVICRSSSLLLDLAFALPPATTPDIASLLSTACLATVAGSTFTQPTRADEILAFASKDFLRMMDLLPLVGAPQQLQILKCAHAVMLASPASRAAFRLHGASAVAATVEVMMGEPSLGATAAAAASVLPFICSDRIDDPVNVTAIPTLYSSAATKIKSVLSCADFTHWTASVLEGLVDLLYSCRSP